MNDLRKVLVVDNGDRGEVDPLAAELAELGLSSVTTSLDAAADVIAVIERPSAIFLKMPPERHSPDYERFLALADQLRNGPATSGIPLIVWDRTSAFQAGGISAVLQTTYGPQVFAAAAL